MTNIGLIGAGLIGRRRLAAIETLKTRGRSLEVVAVLDTHNPQAAALASAAGAVLVPSPDALLESGLDWVFVATPHDVAAELLPDLLRSGVRVLVEKPLGRCGAEAQRLASISQDPDQLWVGLNYRFFEGVAALLADVRAGWFGELVSMSILMGHGGSPGDERTWKLDPVRAGGGALIDPGIHLLDLCRLMAGTEPQVIAGTAWNGYWKTGIEEECHLLLRGGRIPTINLQVSIVRWRSTFRLEVHGVDGYGIVEGRDRSYGPQSYRRGRRWAWETQGSQAESEETFVGSDGDVFAAELDSVLFRRLDAAQPCSGRDAVPLMRLVDSCREVLSLPTEPFYVADG